MRIHLRTWVCAVLALTFCGEVSNRLVGQELPPISGADRADPQALEAEPTWRFPDPLIVREQLIQIASNRGITPEQGDQLDGIWQNVTQGAGQEQVLNLTAESLSIIYPDSKPWLDVYLDRAVFPPGDWTGFVPALGLDPWSEAQVRTLVGIAAVRQGWYDESVVVLESVTPELSIAPDTLLFQRAVALHQLVQKDLAIRDLERLLERKDEIPRRYRDLAVLMLADLETLEADSLDEVARLMGDVRRRIDRHHSGRRVLDTEQDVIDKLDKMIEKLEQQQQQQQQMATLAPSTPAPDSVLRGGSAPGEVDERPQGSGEDWGDLPPDERAAAMAEMAQDLPSHYRELIEEYFRKLSEENPGEGDR